MDSSTGSRQPRSDCTATWLRSRSPTNWPALPGACWPTAAFLKQSFRPREHLYEVELPAEVCERIRRDGGSVFPAYANTGDPNGPTLDDAAFGAASDVACCGRVHRGCGLVGGEGFAVDASLIVADANKQRSTPGA